MDRSDALHPRLAVITKAAHEIHAACHHAAIGTISIDGSVRQVARRLDIGDYTAWKFLNLLRAVTTADIIAAIPGERGRQAIIEAIERRATDADTPRRLREAFDAFFTICRDLGCRPGEVAMMTGLDREPAATTKRRERAARRMAKDYAELRGHRIDLVLGGIIALPSPEDPEFFDVWAYQLSHGITRFRSGLPILVHMQEEIEDEACRVRTDGLGSLVREAGTPDLEEAELVVSRRGERTLLHVDPRPDRIEPVTTGFLEFTPRMGRILFEPEYTTPRRRWYEVTSTPIRRVVIEYLQPRSIPGPTDAFAVSEFVPPTGSHFPDPVELDPVPLDVPVESISTPILSDDLATARPYHDALIRKALSGTDWRVEDLCGIRATQVDPPPGTMLTLAHFAPTRDE